MQKLFNNPLFVGALGLLAAGYFAFTVVLPFFGNEAEASADMPPMELENDAFASSEPADLPMGEPVDKSRIRWLRDVPRDPFGEGPIASGEASSDGWELPRLQALFTSAANRSAVINDELVREGDQVAGLRVVQIDNGGVTVAYGSTEYRLEPQL